ncbi:MAG: RdgB/HAM1 family non-canonical purine pyrophosphatase, dITP/XTP pyrophosphatase [Candidatus Saccharibacteria bacterium]|nr:RdgB/HAM1 family non-canonical purine pyrophosphatase, dITP/XTP pyrophosphatase [Candidatus Saccharibacteria bacterium]
MASFTFITSNDLKVLAARAVCEPRGVSFDRLSLDFVEIQADSGEAIAADKALQAYAHLKAPVVITDDSWIIPGLGGFPGPYMKYIDQYFTVDDYLRLCAELSDRTIILRQYIVYRDAQGEQAFVRDRVGVLLKAPRGEAEISHLRITSFDGGEHSVAEQVAGGISAMGGLATTWNDFCDWLTQRKV